MRFECEHSHIPNYKSGAQVRDPINVTFLYFVFFCKNVSGWFSFHFLYDVISHYGWKKMAFNRCVDLIIYRMCSKLAIFEEIFLTYIALFRVPLIFLQLAPSPPQTPHLSSLRLEPMMWSQPALMHCPWTQIDVVSGPQAVPSTT